MTIGTRVSPAALFVCLLHVSFDACSSTSNSGDDVAMLQAEAQQPHLQQLTRRVSPTFRLGKRSATELPDFVRRSPTFRLGGKRSGYSSQWTGVNRGTGNDLLLHDEPDNSWEGFRLAADDFPESEVMRRSDDEFMANSLSPTFRMGKRHITFRLGGKRQGPTFRMGKRAPLSPAFRLGGKRDLMVRPGQRQFEELDVAETLNRLMRVDADDENDEEVAAADGRRAVAAVQFDTAKHPMTSTRFVEDDGVAAGIVEFNKVIAEAEKRSPTFRLGGRKRSASPSFRLEKTDDDAADE